MWIAWRLSKRDAPTGAPLFRLAPELPTSQTVKFNGQTQLSDQPDVLTMRDNDGKSILFH
jgi:hypothetical protein